MAWAPPTEKTSSTPATRAATSVYGFTLPSLPAGVHMATCPTPATLAGMAFMSTVEG